jgi:predicted nucleic acid-binding protein
VTGDRDLLELEDIGVAVITPRELVERLADAS